MVNSELKAPSPTHNLARTHTGDLQRRGAGRWVGRYRQGPGYTGVYTPADHIPNITCRHIPRQCVCVCVCVLAQLLIFLQCWGVGKGRVKPFITSIVGLGSGVKPRYLYKVVTQNTSCTSEGKQLFLMNKLSTGVKVDNCLKQIE